MNDHLEQQLVNELRAAIQPINETYKDFFHVNLITLCDMKDMKCSTCTDSTTGQECKRCVIGYEEISKQP
jgi:Laminin EGF domain